MAAIEDRPTPIALVHGFASSFDHTWRKNGWVDILGDLARPLVPIDLLGHGTAPRPTDAAAYGDVDETVNAALPEGPLDAVGFSAGAAVLLHLAVDHPGRFRRLALLGLGDNVFGGSEPMLTIDALEGRTGPEDVQGRLFRHLAESAGNDPAALAAFLRRPARLLTEPELASVDCPVLLVLGDRDFIGGADRLMAALPRGELVTLRGVDHFATASDFGAIDAVMGFLEDPSP
ncbi:MAG TPA: alpha/beta fold hydrolase [Acidimicrobiales bacterium]|nr:alpha/beta fold hydrolase [Acidimicrobiales bacterium]